MKNSTLFIFTLCLLGSMRLSAQTTNVGHQWVYYGGPSASASSCVVDSNAVWIGSYGSGLLRLDRNTGAVTSENNTNTHLPGNAIPQVYRDKQNRLWAFSDYNGIYQQVGNTWKKMWGNFVDTSFYSTLHIEQEEIGGSLLFNGDITIKQPNTNTIRYYSRIRYDGQSFSTIANDDGVGYQDYYKNNWRGDSAGTSVVKRDSLGNQTIALLPNNQHAYSFKEDKQHRIWVLTNTHSYQTSYGKYLYYKNGNTWTHLPTPVDNVANVEINSIYFDNQNNIYCILSNSNATPYLQGMIRYDQASQTWTTYNYNNGTLPGPNMTAITVSDDGHWWYSNFAYNTYNNAYLYEYTGTQWRAYYLKYSVLPEIPSNIQASPNTGTLWGNQEGFLARFNGQAWQAERTNQGRKMPLSWFKVAPDQKVWFVKEGYSDSIFIYNPVTHQQTFNLLFTRSTSTRVHDIGFDKSGNTWVAHYYGISKCNNGQVTNYNKTNTALPYELTMSVVCDSTNNIWFSCFDDYGGAIVRRSPQNQWTFYNHINSPFPYSNSYMNGYSSLFLGVESDGTLWANSGGKLYKQINNAWQIYNPIQGDTLRATIQYDKQGALWTTGDKGLYKLKNGIWTHYSTENSNLLTRYPNITTIDNNNNKWLAASYYSYNSFIQIFNERGVNVESVLQSPTLLTGLTFYDLNQNGIHDANEPSVGGHEIVQNNRRHFWTIAPNGFRIYSNPSRTDTLLCRPAYNWRSTSDSIKYINTGLTGAANIEFGVYPKIMKDSVNVTGIVSDRIRCNTSTPFRFVIQNKGTTLKTSELEVRLDSAVTYISSSQALLSNTNGVLRFAIPIIPLNDFYTLQIDGRVPTSAVGRPSLHRAKILMRNAQNAITSQDSTLLTQIVTCSYDPNDKTSHSEGRSLGEQVLLGDALNYTIQFQNKGNDTAFTVVIRDTLHNGLDPNSFEFIGASHPVRAARDGRALSFTFNPITLDYTAHNEAASQGFVTFKVRPRNTLSAPTTVTNIAHIYFDFNPAITTNTAQNTYVQYLNSPVYTVLPPLSFIVQPNPVINTAQIVTNESLYALTLTDISGKIVWQQNNIMQRTTDIPMENLPAATYFVTLQTNAGKTTQKIIKM
jgi:uncharacterized repeat protein (TIGR01451 family)